MSEHLFCWLRLDFTTHTKVFKSPLQKEYFVSSMSHSDSSPTANGQLPETRSHRTSSKSSTSRVEDDDIEPIAIVGFSARLPQDGESADGFWKMICEGRSAASAIPKARFNADAFYHPDVDRIDTVRSYNNCNP